MERLFEAGTIGIYFYIGMSVLGLIVWCVWMVWIFRRYHTKHDGSNIITTGREDREGWHDAMDTPCPGSFIVCEDTKHQLFFGYSVASDGRPALLHLPNFIQDYKNPPMAVARKTPSPIPVGLFKRWQYIERRILPNETLSTYAQQYKD